MNTNAHWDALEASWNDYAEQERQDAAWEPFNAQWSYESELRAEHAEHPETLAAETADNEAQAESEAAQIKEIEFPF